MEIDFTLTEASHAGGVAIGGTRPAHRLMRAHPSALLAAARRRLNPAPQSSDRCIDPLPEP
ncbi:hypothetical protein [Paraburkholderia sp. HD33-4]|uniref:hypothetical protein n=1 Tax=Paraburkholderia sp. HD33-4 TaxID=2883242 RepID=UPI001F1C0AA4|nr:hypothetical protein [Paraburkholderia sp. HD33-4]